MLQSQSKQEMNAQEATAEHEANEGKQREHKGEQETSHYDRVRAYLAAHQKATDGDVAEALAYFNTNDTEPI